VDAVDVLRMRPEHPDRQSARAKFLAEQTHDDDEVRFFVEGRGASFVHAGNRVLEIVCERDDLISVPAGAKHWFDMGERPNFTTIRMFARPDGWVASFLGDKIATQSSARSCLRGRQNSSRCVRLILQLTRGMELARAFPRSQRIGGGADSSLS
jgi:cupin superfamily acireductone dioxygenase involved in methionine salvage